MRPPRGTNRSPRRTQTRRNYQRYMASEQWQLVRRNWDALHRMLNEGQPPRCAICDAEWRLAHDDLHHLTYDQLGDETYPDLMALCRPCHELLHQWLDASPAWRQLPLRTASLELVTRLRRRP